MLPDALRLLGNLWSYRKAAHTDTGMRCRPIQVQFERRTYGLRRGGHAIGRNPFPWHPTPCCCDISRLGFRIPSMRTTPWNAILRKTSAARKKALFEPDSDCNGALRVGVCHGPSSGRWPAVVSSCGAPWHALYGGDKEETQIRGVHGCRSSSRTVAVTACSNLNFKLSLDALY